MAANALLENSRSMEKKWGSEVAGAGFTALPNHLLSINQFLPPNEQISPTEMLILLQVLAAWWSADRMPFPSKATIGRRAGLSPRQVQRALSSLEQKGLIRKLVRVHENRARASNAYDVTGLVQQVRNLAVHHPKAFKRGTATGAEEQEK
ncbi:MAG TPA: helix-turn-helix domain-containing protein [Stellaceae bacterium]|nr:helix-turn-helix domain-containing protein [Stellaceae bacterium]